jgi:hypothetical protein
MRIYVGRAIALVAVGFAAGCSRSSGEASDGGSDSGDLAACAPTLADYCAQPDAVCAMTWPDAQSIASDPSCGGVYLYACEGFDVASCPGDEGGGHTLVFDPTSQALIAVVAYPSLVPGGRPGCFVGPESLRSSLKSGPPGCPTGPLLGPNGPLVPMSEGGGSGATSDAPSDSSVADTSRGE